jgi:hypothetical protein
MAHHPASCPRYGNVATHGLCSQLLQEFPTQTLALSFHKLHDQPLDLRAVDDAIQ